MLTGSCEGRQRRPATERFKDAISSKLAQFVWRGDVSGAWLNRAIPDTPHNKENRAAA
jgi:hypothetical protein